MIYRVRRSSFDEIKKSINEKFLCYIGRNDPNTDV